MHCLTCQLLFHTILSSQQTAMVTLVDELKEVLLRHLPNLSEAVQETSFERLLSSGLESREDLKYVKQEDIADLLPVIRQRKRLDTFQLGLFAYLLFNYTSYFLYYYFFFQLKAVWIISYFVSILETETITLDLEVFSHRCRQKWFCIPFQSSVLSCSATSPFSSPSTSSVHSGSASNVTEDKQPSSHVQKSWPESFQVPLNLITFVWPYQMARGLHLLHGGRWQEC